MGGSAEMDRTHERNDRHGSLRPMRIGALLIVLGAIGIAACAVEAPSDASPAAAQPGAAAQRGAPGREAAAKNAGDTGATAMALLRESEMNLLQLRETQSFVYAEGGRDPMTFRTVRKEAQRPDLPEQPKPDKATVTETATMASDVTALDQERVMQSAWTTAETYFISENHDAAIKEIDRGADLANQWRVPWPSSKERKLFEKLLGLRETARRLAFKNSIVKEFGTLPLSVDAVQTSDRGSAAVINDHVYEVGERLTIGSGAVLVIDSVDSEGVTFEYKGQKLRRLVGAEPQAPQAEESVKAPATRADPAGKGAGKAK